ncbi:MAG: type I phosphomannose isomerase catalytic subunit, partial [Thermotaleaceae bacterium]
MMYPIKFKPIYKEKIWGGNNIEKIFKRVVESDKPIGESWELCAHNQGTSIVANGSFAGKTIAALFNAYGEEILGKNHKHFKDRFPLLIKFIDANDKLSVQVHPSDEYAL